MSGLPADLWDGLALETARLALRPLVDEDAPALQAITDDPAVAPLVSFLPVPFTLADARALIARNAPRAPERFMGVRVADELVGVVGAHAHAGLDDRPAIEIGYWLGAGARGRGYAREAARGLVVRLRALAPHAAIVAEVAPANATSARLLRDLGFVEAGSPGMRPGRALLVLAGDGR